MSHILRWLLLGLLSLVVPAQSIAADWYAEAAGDDANNCSSAAKCESFERLIERSISAGDTLYLKCGETYRETTTFITPQTSGTQSAPITLDAYGTCFRRQGTHTGSAGAANLVDSTVNFSTLGVSATEMSRGITLFNLTDGSTCNVSSVTTTTSTNDTLVCSMGLAGGKDNNWGVGDRYRIDNLPTVTHASLFNSGWTNEGSNVWSHAFTKHPGRMVWINGWSPHSALHTGTCTASGMASASDRQWCALCTGSSVRDCGPGKVYIKSTSNPATRWTTPGVEAVHVITTGDTFFRGSTTAWWVVRNVAFDRTKGTNISWSGNNMTFQGLRLGWSQRHTCTSGTGCWELNNYSWQVGQDDSGSEVFSVGNNSAPQTGLVVSDVLAYECENNCFSFTGSNNITGTITDVEIFANIHSAINTGLSASTASTRNLIFTRLNLHGNTTHFHSDNNGATQTLLVQNSLFYDAIPGVGTDPRVFSRGEGRVDPFGVFIEDVGTYTWKNNVIVDNAGHGMRLNNGTHTLTGNVIRGNSHTGVNARPAPRIRLNNNIIADNGSSTAGSNRFQIGCGFSPCSLATYENAASNTNKFRQPSGSDFAWFSGLNVLGGTASVNLSEWQTITGGDSASVVTDDCFVSPSTFDFNLTTGCDDIAALRGPYREITPGASTIVGRTLTTTWNAASGLPVTDCDVADASVTYTGVGQTEQSCTPGTPSANATTITMENSPGVGTAVTLAGAYGLVEDATRIGTYLNARSRDFSGHSVTNSTTAPTTAGCAVGTTREIATGTNRLLVVNGCWERQAPTDPPLAFTGCTYGGQAMTLIAEANMTSGTDPWVLASQWYLKDAQIAAATSTTIACTPDESVQSGRPIVLASCVYENINQTTPLTGVPRTATEPTGSTVTTAALGSTTNPGVAITLACAGNNGAWTPGSGWTEQIDAGEDGDPGTRIFVADRATTGDTPAGSATFATAQAFSNRLTMTTAALAGGSQDPPAVSPTFRQSHVAVYRARYPEGTERVCQVDGVCELAPGAQFTARAQVEVETAASPAYVYEWWCSDNGGAYYQVSNNSTGWVSFSPSFRLNEPLSNQLSLDGDTFVACGVHYNILTTTPPSCSTSAAGQRFEVEFSGVVSTAATIGQGIVCRLRQAGGVPLGTYTEDVELSVTRPAASGF